MPEFTLIIPYYRQPEMLSKQLREMELYSDKASLIVVDDGSPELAEDVVRNKASRSLIKRLRLYRILDDKPWNREMARNLGAREAETSWLVQVDIDHIMPHGSVKALLDFKADPSCWYKFPRWRVGKADNTRRKDRLLDTCEFGEIKPHMDSYLCTKKAYWEAGGYDEIFSGVLGGGSDFLYRLKAIGNESLLPPTICLHVHTRHSVKDASDSHCDRNRQPGKDIERRKNRNKRGKPTEWLMLPWERVL